MDEASEFQCFFLIRSFGVFTSIYIRWMCVSLCFIKMYYEIWNGKRLDHFTKNDSNETKRKEEKKCFLDGEVAAFYNEMTD